MSDFAERLKYLRRKKGYSQRKLAALAGITQQALAKIEGGSMPRLRTLFGICKALEVTIESFADLGPL